MGAGIGGTVALTTWNWCGAVLPRSDYTRVGRGHDQELDMDMEYNSPPTSLMEAVSRAGSSISSSTSTSTIFRHGRVPDHDGRIRDSDSSCDSDSSNLLEKRGVLQH